MWLPVEIWSSLLAIKNSYIREFAPHGVKWSTGIQFQHFLHATSIVSSSNCSFHAVHLNWKRNSWAMAYQLYFEFRKVFFSPSHWLSSAPTLLKPSKQKFKEKAVCYSLYIIYKNSLQKIVSHWERCFMPQLEFFTLQKHQCRRTTTLVEDTL